MGWKLWKRKGNKAVEAAKNSIIKEDKAVNPDCKSTGKRSSLRNLLYRLKGLFLDLLKRNRDIIASYGEIGIDTVTENKLVKQIPIIKTVIAAYRVILIQHFIERKRREITPRRIPSEVSIIP